MPFAGVIPVVHTPFRHDDSIDYASLQRQIEWGREQGAHGIATGMVSELVRLTASERDELTRELAQMSGADLPFIAGIGGESTRQAVEFGRAAEASGASGAMATPPLVSGVSSEETERYFRTLAETIDLPLVVQDASSYVGQPIPVEVLVSLLDRFGPEKVLFKPESSPLGPGISRLRDATAGSARIFEGSGGIGLIDNYRRGLRGTMPGMEFLHGIVAVWRALEAGDEETAYRVYFPVCALVALQLQAGLDGFLEIEKYLLHQRGLFDTDRRRGPVGWHLDAETRAEVDRLMARLQAALEA